MIKRISVRVEQCGPDLTNYDFLQYNSANDELFAIMYNAVGVAFQGDEGIVYKIDWNEILKGIKRS